MEVLRLDQLFGAERAYFLRREQERRQDTLLRIRGLWEQPVNIR
jgi:hypothetical protein